VPLSEICLIFGSKWAIFFNFFAFRLGEGASAPLLNTPLLVSYHRKTAQRRLSNRDDDDDDDDDDCKGPVAVLRWGQRGTGPPNLAQAPKFFSG